MPRLLLLPGLGADERLFAGLGPLCLPRVAAHLPTPAPGESLTRYALRLAARHQLHADDWIGGSSFGALVAADIARHRPVAGLILIGGALSSQALPGPVRVLARLSANLPTRALRAMLAREALLSLAFQPLSGEALQLISAMLTDTPDEVLCEGARLVASSRSTLPLLCAAHAIHGARDRLMAPPPVANCRLLPDAGHALALTHAGAVTAFLNETICGRDPSCSEQEGSAGTGADGGRQRR